MQAGLSARAPGVSQPQGGDGAVGAKLGAAAWPDGKELEVRSEGHWQAWEMQILGNHCPSAEWGQGRYEEGTSC